MNLTVKKGDKVLWVYGWKMPAVVRKKLNVSYDALTDGRRYDEIAYAHGVLRVQAEAGDRLRLKTPVRDASGLVCQTELEAVVERHTYEADGPDTLVPWCEWASLGTFDLTYTVTGPPSRPS